MLANPCIEMHLNVKKWRVLYKSSENEHQLFDMTDRIEGNVIEKAPRFMGDLSLPSTGVGVGWGVQLLV